MKDKHQQIMNELYLKIDDKYKNMFADLAEFAFDLGYFPKKNKTKDISIDFHNNKIKKTVMKFEEKEQNHDGYGYGERKIPGLRLKFFASDIYSEIFKEGIRRVIEEFGGKYTGCYGCGRCKEDLQGYTYIYPDGRKIFRCGSELISIFDFSDDTLDEIKSLLKNQAVFFEKLFIKNYEN